jgi:hypothetical protein
MKTRRRSAGFTLIEILAALISTVVVLGAATGFVLSCVARQKITLSGSSQEARHSLLAQTISSTLKTADDFQIHAALAGSSDSGFGPGGSKGAVLLCQTLAEEGSVLHVFRFNSELSALVHTATFPSGKSVTRTYEGAQLAPNEQAVFNMRMGVPHAVWQVRTELELIDFHVCAMPLKMR